MVSSKTARVRKIFRKTPAKVYSNLKKTCTKGCPAQEQDFLNVELTVCLFFAEVFELLLVRFLHCVFCFLFTLIKLIY